MVTKRDKAILRKVKKISKQALKKQTQDGLAKVFNMLKCRGVAKEIKAGRKVTRQAAYGFRMCVHERLGPRVDPETGSFSPMTKEGKRIERGFVKNINGMLVNGGFKPMPSNLLSSVWKRDKAFEKRMKKRFGR